MTQSKPEFRQLLVLVAVLALVPDRAVAGPAMEAAQAKRAQAFNDFYKQYQKSKNKTPARVSEIRNRTITPANEELSRALAQEATEAQSHMGAKTISEGEFAEMKKRSKKLASEKARDPSRAGDKGGKNSKSGGKDAPPSSLNFGGRGSSMGERPVDSGKSPETKIDGSKIPSSIQFQKQKPKVEEED